MKVSREQEDKTRCDKKIDTGTTFGRSEETLKSGDRTGESSNGTGWREQRGAAPRDVGKKSWKKETDSTRSASRRSCTELATNAAHGAFQGWTASSLRSKLSTLSSPPSKNAASSLSLPTSLSLSLSLSLFVLVFLSFSGSIGKSVPVSLGSFSSSFPRSFVFVRVRRSRHDGGAILSHDSAALRNEQKARWAAQAAGAGCRGVEERAWSLCDSGTHRGYTRALSKARKFAPVPQTRVRGEASNLSLSLSVFASVRADLASHGMRHNYNL